MHPHTPIQVTSPLSSVLASLFRRAWHSWKCAYVLSSDSALPHVPASITTESGCCMCNCKSTLQAILLELRTMRKLMQTQRGMASCIRMHTTIDGILFFSFSMHSFTCAMWTLGPPEKQRVAASAAPACRRRSRKRRVGQRLIALTPPTKTPMRLDTPMMAESFEKICQEKDEHEEETKERAVPSPPTTPVANPPPSAHYSLNRDQNCTEVQMIVFACAYTLYRYFYI